MGNYTLKKKYHLLKYYFNVLKGNYYNLYDADYEKWTKCFKKYATLLDILLGVCKFPGYTAHFSIISSKLVHTELYIQ